VISSPYSLLRREKSPKGIRGESKYHKVVSMVEDVRNGESVHPLFKGINCFFEAKGDRASPNLYPDFNPRVLT
jgi:hypothetical protein